MIPRAARRFACSLAVLGALAAAAAPAGAGPNTPVPSAGPTEDPRVLIVTLPGADWADLESGVAPTIAASARSGLVANLSMRTYTPLPSAADAAATFGAGTRARGGAFGGNAMEREETSEGVTTQTLYEQRFGESPGSASIVNLAAPRIIRANGSDLYAAQVGRLGSLLKEHGIRVGVVANGDADRDPEQRNRTATLALMDERGQIACGAVGRSLLETNTRAAFGIQYAQDAVVDHLNRCVGMPGRGSVTLFDAADLARAYSYSSVSTDEAAAKQLTLAWTNTDAIVARVLKERQPDVVIYLGWSPANRTRSLGVFSVVGARYPAGIAVSGTTRQDGFVAATDLAPTILDLFGIERDSSMDGRPIELAEGSSLHLSDLVDANRTASWFDSTVGLFRTVVLVWILALIGAGLLSLRHHRWLLPFRAIALALLLVLPLTTLIMAAPVADLGTAGSVALLVAVALLGGYGLAHLSSWTAAVVALTFVIAVPILSVVVFGSTWQVSSIFGNSPVTGGRFAGLNNVAFSFVIAATLGIAAACRQRFGPRADVGIAALFAVVLVVEGAPMWGSDVGGILAGVPIFVVAWLALTGRRVRFTRIALAGISTLLVSAIAIAIDVRRPAAERTHLGRLWERMTTEGIDGFLTVVERKWTLNARALAWGDYWLFTLLAVAVAVLWWKYRDRLSGTTFAGQIGTRYLLVMVFAAVVGTALNDSGIAVPAGLGLVLLGTLGTLALESGAPSYTVPLPTYEERHD